jgi:hypothetical protein
MLQCRDKGASQGVLASLEGWVVLKCVIRRRVECIDRACSQSRYDVGITPPWAAGHIP